MRHGLSIHNPTLRQLLVIIVLIGVVGCSLRVKPLYQGRTYKVLVYKHKCMIRVLEGQLKDSVYRIEKVERKANGHLQAVGQRYQTPADRHVIYFNWVPGSSTMNWSIHAISGPEECLIKENATSDSEAYQVGLTIFKHAGYQ